MSSSKSNTLRICAAPILMRPEAFACPTQAATSGCSCFSGSLQHLAAVGDAEYIECSVGEQVDGQEDVE